MMVVKARGVWYEIADHLGHISLLCVWLETETVEAQLVDCSRGDGRLRDRQTYEKVTVRYCAGNMRRLFCVVLLCGGMFKVTNLKAALP
jgi:hypothetical protein